MKKYVLLFNLPLLAGLMISCAKSEPDRVQAPGGDEGDLTPVFSDTLPPGDPVPIPTIRQTAQPGDTVVLDGRIMGVMEPFVEGRAVFVLGDDDTITSCNEMGTDDHCPTPWDACCDPKEVLRAGVATIQITDDAGKVLKTGLKGSHGLKELSRVKIAGTIAPQSSPEAMIVNAATIYVYP